jgi:hypothetical protein
MFTVKTAEGCFGISDLEVEIGNLNSSRQDFKNGETHSFPNPATNQIFIQFQGANGSFYRLYDASMRLLKSGYFQDYLNIESLSAGIYHIVFEKGPVVRFIKQP